MHAAGRHGVALTGRVGGGSGHGPGDAPEKRWGERWRETGILGQIETENQIERAIIVERVGLRGEREGDGRGR